MDWGWTITAAVFLLLAYLIVTKSFRYTLKLLGIRFGNIYFDVLDLELTVNDFILWMPWFEKLMNESLDVGQWTKPVNLSHSQSPIERCKDKFRIIIVCIHKIKVRPWSWQVNLECLRLHVPSMTSSMELEQKILFPQGYPNYFQMIFKWFGPAIRFLYSHLEVSVTGVELFANPKADFSSKDDVIRVGGVKFVKDFITLTDIYVYQDHKHVYGEESLSSLSIKRLYVSLMFSPPIRRDLPVLGSTPEGTGEEDADQFAYMIQVPLAVPNTYRMPVKVGIRVLDFRLRATNALDVGRRSRVIRYFAQLVDLLHLTGLGSEFSVENDLALCF